jgi:transcription elongation factor Elf1
VAFSECVWVASIIYKSISGKTTSFDVMDIVAELVEISDGGVKCKICGKSLKKTCFWKPHVARKHCDRLLELVGKYGLRRVGTRGRRGKRAFNIRLYCTACGWTHDVTARSSTGPPNVKTLLERMGMARCPSCGKQFEVKGFEFG